MSEAGKILDSIKSKQAPAVIGKPVFEKCLDKAEQVFGTKDLRNVIGKRVDESKNEISLPINLGSKAARTLLTKSERSALLHLRKSVSNLEIQASYVFKGQHVTPAMMETLPAYKMLLPLMKAFNITDFSNWIPTVNARFYFEEYDIPFLLAQSFSDYPMDSATVEVPGDLGHLEGQEETDVASFTAQSNTQSNYSVTSRNNVVHAQITQDLMSDSAPVYMEKLRRDVLVGTVRSYERAILNGSTVQATAVRGDGHHDADIAAQALNACKFQKAFDGLRARAFAADTAVGAGTFVYNHGGDTASKTVFEKLLNMMGKFASEKDDLAYILPSSIENQLVTGAIPELFTAFAFGGLASNVTGQVPPVFGVRPVTSQYMREDLEATGKAASSPAGTTTSVILVKKSRFNNFVRQATRVWAAPSLPSSDVMLMTAKTRHAFGGNPQSANEKSVVMAINIARA